jgi:excisionase family DNA binding protein
VSALLTYKDVARILRISERTTRRLVARRKLRVVKLGHRTMRFRMSDLEACQEKLTR